MGNLFHTNLSNLHKLLSSVKRALPLCRVCCTAAPGLPLTKEAARGVDRTLSHTAPQTRLSTDRCLPAAEHLPRTPRFPLVLPAAVAAKEGGKPDVQLCGCASRKRAERFRAAAIPAAHRPRPGPWGAAGSADCWKPAERRAEHRRAEGKKEPGSPSSGTARRPRAPPGHCVSIQVLNAVCLAMSPTCSAASFGHRSPFLGHAEPRGTVKLICTFQSQLSRAPVSQAGR